MNGKTINAARTDSLDQALISCDLGYETGGRIAMLKIMNELALTTRSLRIWGSGALSVASIGSGRTEGYVRAGSTSWDYAAATIIAREAGGIVTDFNGKPWQPDSRNIVAAANKSLHDKILLHTRVMQL